MPLLPLIEYEDAGPDVRAVYDDIMSTRGTDWVNNFWKVLANHPETLARVWADVKNVMKPGALDPLVKEMVYVAVSATNNCEYCIHSHTAGARARGMTDEMAVGHRLKRLTMTGVLFGDAAYHPKRYASFLPDAFPDAGSGGSQSTPTSRQPDSVRELWRVPGR